MCHAVHSIPDLDFLRQLVYASIKVCQIKQSGTAPPNWKGCSDEDNIEIIISEKYPTSWPS